MGAVESDRLCVKVADVWAQADDVKSDKLIGSKKEHWQLPGQMLQCFMFLLSWPVVLLVLNYQVFSADNSLFLKFYF